MAKASRKKIAIVVPKYGLVGGAEGFVAELTERCARASDHEFHVFANRWIAHGEGIFFHHVPIVRFPKFLITPSFSYFAGRAIARVGCDLIHAHDRIGAADLFTMHGVPHRYWVEEIRKKKMMSLYDRETIRVEKALVRGGRCRRFLPVSTLSREIFLQEYEGLAERVEVFHPGVEAGSDSPAAGAEARRRIRQEYGVGAQEALLLFVSMNFEVKGLDRLLAALALLPAARQFKLLVVGKGDEEKYGRLAARLGVGERLLFAGVKKREELLPIYQAADLYAMLSRFDTFGMVVSEAMAAGLPVLVSGTVGAKDLVREGVNGYVVADPERAELIAEKLLLLLDPLVRAPMAGAARRTAAENSWDRAAARMGQIYEELL